ncbi:MAG: hypothetical protein IT336_08800 [Thermomicrobiales bacterium]|nr:hypothetical protein [Thermomicrobiales bacterium]
MVGTFYRAVALALVALAFGVTQVGAQTHVSVREAPVGHGIWLPLSLIVVLALLTAPAVMPRSGKRQRR